MTDGQTIQVRPATSAGERRAFLTFPWRVYRDDPLWVPPLLRERAERTDPRRGEFFGHGEAECFVAWRGRQPVGTICAGEDRRHNTFSHQRRALFGFFDCLDDYAIAEALFETAAGWARRRGLETIWGPFHLDYEDAYGVLLDGYDRPPAILCGHTPRYYRPFFEKWGFEPARGDNIAYAFDLEKDWAGEKPEKLRRVAELVRRRGRVTVRSADFKDWDGEMARVLRILNAGLSVLPDFTPWATESLTELAKALRPALDPDLILIGEADGEAVGWLPGIPNFNEALQQADGLRRPWDYARLWWAMRRRPACLSIKSIAVEPAYWGRGVDALMLDEMVRRALDKGYRWVDMSLTEDTNPMTNKMASRLGATVYKRYRVYSRKV